jgi:putative spermidine/putrescine transport system substrate-binding protein
MRLSGMVSLLRGAVQRVPKLLVRGLMAATIAAGVGLAPAQAAHHRAASSTIYFYGLDDTNIADLWTGTLLPDFAKAYPQYKVKFVNLLHGNGAQGLIDRIVAARAAGKKTIDLDIFEDVPIAYNFPTGKTAFDYFAPITAKDVPNIRLIDPTVLAQGQKLGVAYRASAVTLAYDTVHVSRPPTTFNGLLAWIKAHPGKFTYCRPEDGGTGDYFVARALLTVMDPRALTRPYNKAAEKNWPKAWALLRSIEPDLYKGGFHPAGNIPVLNLLGRGAIWMATAWSDQGLQARDQGTILPTIQFSQITPPFPGGPSFMSIPKTAQNRAGALTLINFVLRPQEQAKIAKAIEGFPGIRFEYMPASVVKHFGSLTKGFSYWPSGQWNADLEKGWAANVPVGR